MADKIDYFRVATGKKLSDLPKPPTLQQTVAKKFKALKSAYPLRLLGTGVDGEVLISEEDREGHVHIIGTTQEGKSRFLEHLIREDIRRGNGVCLLDPSHWGQTAYDILKFCVSEGHKKVCLIDPYTDRITGVQPFHPKHKEATVANVMDTMKILFGSKDLTETPVIQKYLPAIINVLHNARMTLHEAKYFSEYKRSTWRRKEILEASNEYDWHRMILEESFSYPFRFEKDIGTSTRRLEPFFNSRLDMMFSVPGVDFAKMIAEGWVILVNLFPGKGFTPVHARLLGTTIINEIIYALDRLHDHGWAGVYYLYVDEAGRYANRNLADLLSHAGKTGLRVTLAHQYFSQFEDKYILDAVKNQTKTKIMFNMPNPADRLEMIKLLGYGGDIPHEMAAFANQNLPRQQAVIKIRKDSPKRIRVPDVEKIDVKFDVNDYLHNEWNYSVSEVLKIINSRFSTVIKPDESTTKTTTDTKTAKPRTTPNRRPVGKARVPDKRNEGNKWQSLSEDLPVSAKYADKDGEGKGS